MNKRQKTFLRNEFWILTFNGAFQHVTIYNEGVDEKAKTEFRNELKSYITDYIIPKYANTVDEQDHITSIKNIKEFSKKHNKILKNSQLSIGVCQKLLNLLLKYFWCIDDVKMPPHCPVDRTIQEKGLKCPNPINWTTLDDMDQYLTIINKIKQEATKKNQSIAEWELAVFETIK